MDYKLRNLILTRSGGLQPVVEALNDLLEAARVRYNSEIGPRAFGRLPTEPVPTARRQLIEFRARLGTLIEYALGMIIDDMLRAEHREALRLSFVISHRYPDFYVRDATGDVLLRLECKALHDESDEYSARFATPLAAVSANDDVLLYVAWRWKQVQYAGFPVVFPEVLEGLCIPAIEIAQERDLRVGLLGGFIDHDGKPMVPARGQENQWSEDTNFGKIDRVVHRTRRPEDLTPNLRRFLEFARRHTAARAGADADDSMPDVAPA